MKAAFSLTLLLALFACNNQSKITEEYRSSVEDWKTARLKALVGENGYVNLAGLFWLENDTTTFGASDDNTIKFPSGKGPDFLGSFVLKNDSVWIISNENSGVEMNGHPLTNESLAYSEDMENPIEFSLGSLIWIVIKRGDQFGVRLRDLEHPNLSNMDAIEFYPLDAAYKVIADYEPYDPPKMMKTTNVLGQTYDAKIPGFLTFELKGKSYRIEPNIDEGQLHIRFRDETTGEETYGLGRYLKAEMPSTKAKVVVDFNKAYNPPCAFTEFATCPLPPKENTIDFKVEAGERVYGEH